MKPTEVLFAAATLVAAALAIPTVKAADEYNVSKGTTANGNGLALRGYDAIALASDLKVTPGFAKSTHVHDGVAYYFASEETKKKFAANPAKYTPQYGGYCAFGVALGKKLDGSPRYADIVDGKLYLLLNAAVFEIYKRDRAGTIAKAEKNWMRIHHLTVADANK